MAPAGRPGGAAIIGSHAALGRLGRRSCRASPDGPEGRETSNDESRDRPGEALYSRVGGFSKKESADIVDLVFEMMKETLGRGEKIKISGFGNFVLR